MLTRQREKELCAVLPQKARAVVERVMSPNAKDAELKALTTVFEAVGFPRRTSRLDALPLPAKLTSAQRGLAELLAYRPDLRSTYISRWLLPRQAFVRRRWLGVDPPGAWETLVDFDGERMPLWRAHALLASKNEDTVGKVLFKKVPMPLAQRLEAFVDAALGAYEIEWEALRWGTLQEIRKEKTTWAPRLARHLIEITTANDGFVGGDPYLLKRPLFTALIGSGAALEPEWDSLLPISSSQMRETCNFLRALPSERRAPALLASFAGRSDSYGPELTLQLLPSFPSLELARYVVANVKRIEAAEKPMAKLNALAAKHPELAPALGNVVRTPRHAR
jgi:hypothetical protein